MTAELDLRHRRKSHRGCRRPANLAINPDTLSKEPYRVTVAPADAAAHDCTVGRTGRVIFERRETAP